MSDLDDVIDGDVNECGGCGCEIEYGDTYCMDCEPDSCEDCGVDIPQGEDLCSMCQGERDEAAEEYEDWLDEEDEGE